MTVAEQLEDAPLLGAAYYATSSDLMSTPALHPQVEAFLRERDAAGAHSLHELSVGEAREAELAGLEPVVP